MTAPYRTSSLAWACLPARFAEELVAELHPGERVLWTCLPHRPAIAQRAGGELVAPLAFNGSVLALVALCSREAGSLALAAVPLLALGLSLFQAPLDMWRAMRSAFYAITDRRAIAFDAVATVDRDDIVAVRVWQRGCSGAGDIALIVGRSDRRGLALVGVPKAKAVAQMLLGR